MKSAGTCPICKLELEENDGTPFCAVCHRSYYPIKEELPKNYLEAEQCDLETVSDSASSPILLCSEDSDSNNRFYEADYRKRKQSYLKEHFGNHVNIREY